MMSHIGKGPYMKELNSTLSRLILQGVGPIENQNPKPTISGEELGHYRNHLYHIQE